MEETLTVFRQNLQFQIGKKSDKNYVNICTNFNPIRKTSLIDMIEALPCCRVITCIQRHDETSGGIALQLHSVSTVNDLKDQLQTLLETLVI